MKLHYIPNPHPICKISRYTLLFISHTVQNVKVHVQAMCSESQCAGATCVICSPQLSQELHHLGTFQTPLQQAGRVSFSRGDAPLPILVFAISPVWQADFLCIGSSQAAIIRDMWDSPRDKPDTAEHKATMMRRYLYLWKAGRLLSAENGGCFGQP